MTGIEWHFLIPSRTSLRRGEALNLLIGAGNSADEDILCPVRVWARTDGDPFLLTMEEKKLAGGQTTHVYITVPASSLAAIDDDEFIICLDGEAFPQMICFND